MKQTKAADATKPAEYQFLIGKVEGFDISKEVLTVMGMPSINSS